MVSSSIHTINPIGSSIKAMSISSLFSGLLSKKEKDNIDLQKRITEQTELIKKQRQKLNDRNEKLDEYESAFRMGITEVICLPFRVGDRARKVGGSYEANGTIVAVFKTRNEEDRVVFDFDEPPGMLHIFNTKQLKHI